MFSILLAILIWHHDGAGGSQEGWKKLTEGKRAPPPARAPGVTCRNKVSECGLSRATGSRVLGDLPVQPPHSLLLSVL